MKEVGIMNSPKITSYSAVFAKVKNASIIVDDKQYVIRFHKRGQLFTPYIFQYGYYRSVIIRIFRGEMFAALVPDRYVGDNLEFISLFEYFKNIIRIPEIELLKSTDMSQLRNDIGCNVYAFYPYNINVILCDEISEDADGTCTCNRNNLIYV